MKIAEKLVGIGSFNVMSLYPANFIHRRAGWAALSTARQRDTCSDVSTTKVGFEISTNLFITTREKNT
jgi:hypothetical protein